MLNNIENYRIILGELKNIVEERHQENVASNKAEAIKEDEYLLQKIDTLQRKYQ